MSVAVKNFSFGNGLSGDFTNEDKEHGGTGVGIYYNSSSESVIIQVDGEMTGGQIFIEGKVNLESSQWVPIAVINASNYEYNESILTTGIYSASVDGIQRVRINGQGVVGSVNIFARFSKGA